MSEELKVSVISSERALYEGTATAVVVPALDGEMGIMPMHAPLMTLLGTGTLRVETGSGEHRFRVSNGFLQVVDNHVRVIAEHAEVLA